MNTYLIVMLCGLAFIVGALLMLVVSESAMSARERRQARRRRELTALSESVEQRLRLLAAAEQAQALDYDRVG